MPLPYSIRIPNEGMDENWLPRQFSSWNISLEVEQKKSHTGLGLGVFLWFPVSAFSRVLSAAAVLHIFFIFINIKMKYYRSWSMAGCSQ